LLTVTAMPALSNVFSASAMIATAPQIVVWMPNLSGAPCARAVRIGSVAASAEPPSN